MKLRTSAGVLMVSGSMILLLQLLAGTGMCLSDVCVVLIHGVTAGLQGPECNLRNRERFKVSGGNKRRGSAERNFGS